MGLFGWRARGDKPDVVKRIPLRPKVYDYARIRVHLDQHELATGKHDASIEKSEIVLLLPESILGVLEGSEKDDTGEEEDEDERHLHIDKPPRVRIALGTPHLVGIEAPQHQISPINILDVQVNLLKAALADATQSIRRTTSYIRLTVMGTVTAICIGTFIVILVSEDIAKAAAGIAAVISAVASGSAIGINTLTRDKRDTIQHQKTLTTAIDTLRTATSSRTEETELSKLISTIASFGNADQLKELSRILERMSQKPSQSSRKKRRNPEK